MKAQRGAGPRRGRAEAGTERGSGERRRGAGATQRYELSFMLII